MNKVKLGIAMAEARRFLRKAEAAQKRMKDGEPLGPHYYSGTKENAACKRASLDLTRTLADLRSREE
jgi:hypothetical protein